MTVLKKKKEKKEQNEIITNQHSFGEITLFILSYIKKVPTDNTDQQ